MRNAILISTFLFLLAGCAAEIGDDCIFDADCSPNLDRTCDHEQPGGYCLVVGCAPNTCPEEASCVEFTTPCPEGTDELACELIEPNRKRTYCLQNCAVDKDCRDAYSCLEPEELYAEIIEPGTTETRICSPRLPD